MKPIHPQQHYLRPPKRDREENTPIPAIEVNPIVRAVAENTSVLVPSDPQASSMRQAAAQSVGKSIEEIFPGAGHRALFQILCRTYLAPDDRVLIAEPTYPWVSEEILAVGAAYIDVGRDQHMCIQTDAFKRVLSEQPIRLVFLSDPNPLAGTPVDDELWELMEISDAIWVVDTTWQPYQKDTRSHQRWVRVRDLGAQMGLHALRAGFIEASPEVVASCWQVGRTCTMNAAENAASCAHLENTDYFEQSLQRLQQNTTSLREKLSAVAEIHVSKSEGPALMAGIWGKPSDSLQQALSDAGVKVKGSSAHTWHGNVAQCVDADSDVGELANAWLHALKSLSQ